MSLSNKITIIERLLGVVSEENTKKSFSKIRRRISFENVSTHIKKYVNSCGRVRHKSSQWYKKCVINGLVIDLWQENMHNFEGVDIDEFYDLLEEFLIEKYGDEVEDEIKKFRDDKSIVTESTYLRRRFMPEDIEDQFNEALNYASFKFYDKKSSFYNSDPKVFRRIVINILMDHLHPRLSDWGNQDFPYEEVYEYLTEYYSQRILERYKELNENCYDENEEIIETPKNFNMNNLSKSLDILGVQDEIKKFRDDKSIVTESKTNEYIKSKFDKVFNKLKLKRTYYDVYQYDWFYEDRDFVKVFERNHWGRFWIYGCDEYRELLHIGKLFAMSFKEFQKTLIEYLNDKYEFEEQPLKDIGNENCYDENEEIIETELTERCWKGYTQKGMKTMFGKRYPNCVKRTKK